MGVDRSRYNLKIILTKAAEGTVALDPDYLIYKLRTAKDEARIFLTEQGTSTGNDGDWRSIDDDMKSFSESLPHLIFQVDEMIDYDGEVSQTRYYYSGGKSAKIEPEVRVVWPDFDESHLT